MNFNKVAKPPVEFCGELKWETEKAYRVFDGKEDIWLPKSQVEDMRRVIKGHIFTIPHWLAEEKGII